MSIDSYTTLKTAIGNFIDDADLSTRIPEFITLAEGRINRKLRGLQQQLIATASYDPATNSRYLAEPAGYLEMIDLSVKVASESDNEYKTVSYTPPERILKYYTSAGKPERFTFRNQLEFDRLPDVVYTLRMHFLKKWDIASDETNWVLTNYPDAYLYGSLIETAVYVAEDTRIPYWEKRFNDAIKEINELDDRTRDDGELDVSDLGLMSRRYSGYRIVNDR